VLCRPAVASRRCVRFPRVRVASGMSGSFLASSLSSNTRGLSLEQVAPRSRCRRKVRTAICLHHVVRWLEELGILRWAGRPPAAREPAGDRSGSVPLDLDLACFRVASQSVLLSIGDWAPGLAPAAVICRHPDIAPRDRDRWRLNKMHRSALISVSGMSRRPGSRRACQTEQRLQS
jgi:hypothetical protein